MIEKEFSEESNGDNRSESVDVIEEQASHEEFSNSRRSDNDYAENQRNLLKSSLEL